MMALLYRINRFVKLSDTVYYRARNIIRKSITYRKEFNKIQEKTNLKQINILISNLIIFSSQELF